MGFNSSYGWFAKGKAKICGSKVSFGLKRDAEKKALKATFQVRVRAIQPERAILQNLLEIEGVRAVNLA